jgi:ATPase subunit of ABC transporter with duplicated ATPase domains
MPPQTLAALEEFLMEEYQGVLVVVSHDRRFMDRVAKQLFVFEGDGIVRNFVGSLSDFLEFEKALAQESAAEPRGQVGEGAGGGKKGAGAEKQKSVSRKLTNKEKREYEGLEATIEGLRKQREEYEQKLKDGYSVSSTGGTVRRTYAYVWPHPDASKLLARLSLMLPDAVALTAGCCAADGFGVHGARRVDQSR